MYRIMLAAALTCALGCGISRAQGNDLVKAKARAASDELSSTLTLVFRDAITCAPLEDAEVVFEGKTARTDARGLASFPFPRIPAHVDKTLTAVFSKKGYVTTKAPVLFSVGTVFNNAFSISPKLPPGKMRIVLDWGERPADLDAHLVKKGLYHISFRDTQHYLEQARLDRDDMDGHGPETITLDAPSADGEYIYFVHDFTNRTARAQGQLGPSHARIMIFQNDALVKTLEVHGTSGKYWTVFGIRGGEIIPIDRLGETPLDSIPSASAVQARSAAEDFPPTMPDELE